VSDPIEDAWTTPALVFDGSVNDAGFAGKFTGSGGGKMLFALVDDAGDLFMSSVAHNGNTETYVGTIASTQFFNSGWIAVSPTLWVIMSASGYVSSCTNGSEGTIGSWTEHGRMLNTTSEGITLEHVYYDGGNIGSSKTGIGFVATGKNNSTAKGVVYTSPDGQTWTKQDEWARSNSTGQMGATKYPTDLS
jgi:hypothetical protein